MNQEIIDYLNSAEPDFSTGFALFCKFSRNESLMSWIGRKHDMEKLLYELQNMAKLDNPRLNPLKDANIARYWKDPDLPMPSVPETPAPVKTIFKTYDERKTRRADLPENLQKVYDTISEDYKLRRGLHEKMKLATTNDDRASLRARILETDGRIRGGWAEIDAYLTKQAQEAEKAKADDFKESTARSYISKMLKKETLSAAQQATIKARYEALLSHGCTVTEDLTKQLKERKLI